MSFLISAVFTEPEVRDYEIRRYKGLDQRWVHARETKILGRALRAAGLAGTGFHALDVPCGYGRFRGLLLEAGADLVCSDLSAAMVGRAMSGEAGAKRLPGVVADVKGRLPFREGAFPLVLSVRLFHHLQSSPDRRAALSELARVCSGWALVSFYRMNSLHRLQRSLRGKVKGKKRRIKMVPLREFRSEAQAAGLRVVRLYHLLRGVHGQCFALLEKVRT